MLNVHWAHVERQRLWLVHGVPWMLPYLFNCDAFGWVRLEYAVDHVLGLRRQELGQRVIGVQDLPV